MVTRVKREWWSIDPGLLTGRRIVVTGATNGVGLATAQALSSAGAEVVLAVRDVGLGHRRAAALPGPSEVQHVDLADLSSVRAFAERLEGPVDALVNNAGVMPRRRPSDTPDGWEPVIATNFLGPFALTNLLLPRITRRVVTVGSDAHRAGGLALEDLDLRRAGWNAWRAYSRSKLAVMLWGLELDRRLRASGSTVSAMLTHPGWVASNISNQPGVRTLHRAIRAAADVLANDPAQGAAPTLCALSAPIPPGSYIGVDGFRRLRGSPVLAGRSVEACDYETAGRLWRLAADLTGTDALTDVAAD